MRQSRTVFVFGSTISRLLVAFSLCMGLLASNRFASIALSSVLSNEQPYWGAPETIFTHPVASLSVPNIVQDRSGVIHAVWRYSTGTVGQHGVMYSQRDLTGQWSSPEVINPPVSPDPGEFLYLASYPILLDPNDQPQIVLYEKGYTYPLKGYLHYYKRNGAGQWSDPTSITIEEPGASSVAAQQIADGTIYIFSRTSPFLAILRPDSGWELMPYPSLSDANDAITDIEVDRLGILHVLSIAQEDGGKRQVAYRTWSSEGWSEPIILSNPSQNADYSQIAVDSSGDRHFIWYEDGTYDCPPINCTKYSLFYRKMTSETLEAVRKIDDLSESLMFGGSMIEAGADGRVHLIWWHSPLVTETIQASGRYQEIAPTGDIEMERSFDSLPLMFLAKNGDVHLMDQKTIIWHAPGKDWSDPQTWHDPEIDMFLELNYMHAVGNPDSPNGQHAMYIAYGGNVYGGNWKLKLISFDSFNSKPATATPTPPSSPTPTQDATEVPKQACCKTYLPLVGSGSYISDAAACPE